MKNYEKPVVLVNEELAEGVYAASGDAGQGGSTYECDSIYMNGRFHKPTYKNGDAFIDFRGCEGCPAWNGGSCRLISAPHEMNWDGDFRPTWEVAGHGPDEKGY